MPDRERTKLSLSVLGAAATLLAAALLMIALIAGPNPARPGGDVTAPRPDQIEAAAPPATPTKTEAPQAEPTRAELPAAPPIPAPEPTSTPIVPAASPAPPADPIATGAIQDQAATARPAEPATAETASNAHGTGAMPSPEPHAANTATPTAEDHAVVDAGPAVDAAPAHETSPTQTRVEEMQTEVASAAPTAAPEATAQEVPIAPSALEMSSTQTREQPVEIGPKVEWNEPQAVEPASAEPGTPQVLAEVQPTPPAQTDNAQAQPPLPSRVERPKESAVAEPVQSRIKAKPMMVGTGGVLPKPSPPKNSAGAGSYSAAVRSAIGRNKAAATGRGGATVTFAIGPGGGLRAARISKSSGNSALDQAALASVRRAGPFPPPPAGAKSIYSIQIYFH